jgi:bifunctional non-homologous end joining protein LigD
VADKIKVGGRSIKLSNADKVFFPEDKISKGDLIDYYHQIAGVMLPYLEDRPLTMHRFPDGIEGEGFYQQQISDYFPDWIEHLSVEKEGGSVTHVLCQNAATLVYLANQACITPHVWLSRKGRLNYPDLMVFDLDPPTEDFAPVRQAAQLLKSFLSELGMEPLVKTTGSRGLHVVVPLDRKADFDEVRSFAQDVAVVLSKQEPERVTAEQRKEKRKGRVFLDYLRNSYGQTAVAPYAVRAKPGAPIAAPIDWDELKDKDMNSQSYTLKNIFRRLSRKKDPWQGMWAKAHSLAKAKQELLDLKKRVAKTEEAG